MAFRRCEALTELVVPNDSRLETIRDHCFARTGLREIELPSGLRKIGSEAFLMCKELRVVYVEGARLPGAEKYFDAQVVIGPPRRTMVGDVLLWDLRALMTVTLPDGIQKVGEGWFARSTIRSVSFPASVRKIEREAFRGCAGLKSLSFQRGAMLECIGAYCFAESGLREVSLPDSVCTVGEAAFKNCADLRHVTLNEGLKELGSRAFAGSALRRVCIPVSLESVTGAFRDCERLEHVELAEGIREIEAGYFRGSTIRSVKIPKSVEVIRESAFEDCMSLRKVTFARGSRLRVVERHAFCRVWLTQAGVRFPAGADAAEAFE